LVKKRRLTKMYGKIRIRHKIWPNSAPKPLKAIDCDFRIRHTKTMQKRPVGQGLRADDQNWQKILVFDQIWVRINFENHWKRFRLYWVNLN
jgi:hypothetical protein